MICKQRSKHPLYRLGAVCCKQGRNMARIKGAGAIVFLARYHAEYLSYLRTQEGRQRQNKRAPRGTLSPLPQPLSRRAKRLHQNMYFAACISSSAYLLWRAVTHSSAQACSREDGISYIPPRVVQRTKNIEIVKTRTLA